MPYTRHGHHVEHGPLKVKPQMVARCGGPGLCVECARDSGQPPVSAQSEIKPLVIEEGSKVTIGSQRYHELLRAEQLLRDLDRCMHGRHAADRCLDCARLQDDVPDLLRLYSRGNPHVRPGVVIGYGHGGQRIAMPEDRADQIVAKRWYRE